MAVTWTKAGVEQALIDEPRCSSCKHALLLHDYPDVKDPCVCFHCELKATNG